MAVSLDHARDLVLADCRTVPSESVSVTDALGRVLADPLIAKTAVPPFDNSAMDGFAVTAGPAGRTLRVVDESLAGAPAAAGLDDAVAIRISTGAALPRQTDAVVPDELASLVDGRVELHAEAVPGLNVRRAGEDIPAGRTLLHPGSLLGPVELAVAIGTGHAELVCHRRPRVVVLGTGNELRPPGDPLAPGQIYDSNTTTLAALATDAGGLVVSSGRVPDDLGATRHALTAALADADLVILTGGVSVGPQDHVRAALAALAAVERFSGITVRPGRPAWFGTAANVPVLALPGNPVAAIVIFLLLGRPALAVLAGRRQPPTERARLADRAKPNPGRTTVVGMTIRQPPDRPAEAVSHGPLSAHATSPLLGFDAIGVLPPGDAWLEAGTTVEIVRLAGRT